MLLSRVGQRINLMWSDAAREAAAAARKAGAEAGARGAESATRFTSNGNVPRLDAAGASEKAGRASEAADDSASHDRAGDMHATAKDAQIKAAGIARQNGDHAVADAHQKAADSHGVAAAQHYLAASLGKNSPVAKGGIVSRIKGLFS